LIPKVARTRKLGNAILADAMARAGLGNAVVNVAAAVHSPIPAKTNALVRATLIEAPAAIAIDPARHCTLVDIRLARDPGVPSAANALNP
jgi:hypothetical protein